MGGIVQEWLFGYGSLIWRPDFPFLERRRARVRGYERRFWQGSHDHRGVPEAPGRVVTLVPAQGAICDGVAYRLAREVLEGTFEHLDHREKNGYERHTVAIELAREARENERKTAAEKVQGVLYVARRDNFAFLGDAPLHEMVSQVRRAHGPSGPNAEYVLELARVLGEMDADDPHVFELAAALQRQ